MTNNTPVPAGMTFREAKKHLGALGISLELTGEGREMRMNKGKREATAYYTDDIDDIDDAVGTAYAQYINKKNYAKVCTELTDAAGVVREVRGVVKPETAARNGWKNLSLVFRDAAGHVTDKTQIA